MDDTIEPRRSSRPRRQGATIETLGENAPAAQCGIAAEATRDKQKSNRMACQW
jgi:ribosomal protein S16